MPRIRIERDELDLPKHLITGVTQSITHIIGKVAVLDYILMQISQEIIIMDMKDSRKADANSDHSLKSVNVTTIKP